jgi:hypothetical protein
VARVLTERFDQTTEEKVEAWRLRTLIKAGYPQQLADELAKRNDVDLHRAVKLVEGGCPPRLAYDILR